MKEGLVKGVLARRLSRKRSWGSGMEKLRGIGANAEEADMGGDIGVDIVGIVGFVGGVIAVVEAVVGVIKEVVKKVMKEVIDREDQWGGRSGGDGKS
ncbi:hypothetical protein TrRE_jg7781 [Triparma retinervis]|uniref:Uncharacterized protein n=1 Tax=Triparma retinervis TaxID=2557542 RepID=A0A9W7DXX4_9STRA|nr:hypothetical protein TrRE_jg7781 [Triparma retinervis]